MALSQMITYLLPNNKEVFFQNGNLLSVNYDKDARLTDLSIDGDVILKGLFLFRCSNDYEKSCTGNNCPVSAKNLNFKIE